ARPAPRAGRWRPAGPLRPRALSCDRGVLTRAAGFLEARAARGDWTAAARASGHAARSAGPGRRCARRSARRRRALSEPESDAREHALDDAIAAGAVEGKRRQRGRPDAGEELVAHGRAGA